MYTQLRPFLSYIEVLNEFLPIKLMAPLNNNPERMAQIQMENEMKQLAEMTSDSLRDIFDKVGRKNKQVAARINFERVYAAMNARRSRAVKKDLNSP